MIEFRFIDMESWASGVVDDYTTKWMSSTIEIMLENINFERAELRIDGVVYKEDSEELRKAFAKAKTWMVLQD